MSGQNDEYNCQDQDLKIRCAICNKAVNDKSHFARHPKCSSCQRRACYVSNCTDKPPEKFGNPGNQEKIIKCGLCDYVCKQLFELKRHYDVHLGAFRFKCTHCDFVARQEQSLVRHRKLRHEKIQIYSCDYCDYKTQRKDNLTRHKRNIHTSTSSVSFICDVCASKCSSQTAFKLHMQNHIEGNFPCRFCKETFNFVQTRWSHEKKFHCEKKFRTDCTYCGRIFRNDDDRLLKESINKHMAAHMRKYDRMKKKCPNSNCIFGAKTKKEINDHRKSCDRTVTEPTSVIAKNPHFKTLSRSVIVDHRIFEGTENPLNLIGPTDESLAGNESEIQQDVSFSSDATFINDDSFLHESFPMNTVISLPQCYHSKLMAHHEADFPAIMPDIITTGGSFIGHKSIGGNLFQPVDQFNDYISLDEEFIANHESIMCDSGRFDFDWGQTCASEINKKESQTADRVQVIVSKKPENSVIVSPPHLSNFFLN